jgi:nucleotide-binding universal stress UspA family protein
MAPLFQKILIPCDLSVLDPNSITAATQLLQPHGGNICLVHIIDQEFISKASTEMEIAEADILERTRRVTGAKMQELASLYGNFAGIVTDWAVLVGDPFERILVMAHENAYDAIVMTVRRTQDLRRNLFGSTAEKIVRGARVPVIIMPFLIDS